MADNIEEIVIKIISDQLDLHPEEVKTSSHLMDDLSLDPYDMEELGSLLSDEFDIVIAKDDIELWESILDVVQLVTEKLVE